MKRGIEEREDNAARSGTFDVTESPTQIFENSTMVGLTFAMLGVFAVIVIGVVTYMAVQKRWLEDGVAAILGVIIFTSLVMVVRQQLLELHVTPSFIGVRQPWRQTAWISKDSIEVQLYPSRWGTDAVFAIARGVPFDGPRRFTLELSFLTEKNRGSNVTAEDILGLGIKARSHSSALWRLL